jgi:hypothetical protein
LHGIIIQLFEVIRHLSFREAFEATIIADYDARSAVEREFVLRLASVLWRLRRAAGIETSLFQSATKQSGPISIENIQPSHDGPNFWAPRTNRKYWQTLVRTQKNRLLKASCG